MMIHEYQLSGMTCGHCVNTVKKVLEAVPGITSAKVSLNPPKAVVEMTHHVSTNELQQALKEHPNFRIEDATTFKVDSNTFDEEDTRPFLEVYKPILLVFGFILGVSLLTELSSGSFELMSWMRNFMAGFFLVFSFFKLLDLHSFAASYSSYDVVAKKWFTWGYIYPFVELMLGILFLLNYQPVLTNIITLIVMGVSTIGVFQSLMNKRRIKCACLGAVFNLPMSTVTLIEDMLMVVMSGMMLLYFV